jgi:hypothetical protein
MVASSGTALTLNRIKINKPSNKKMSLFFFDGDAWVYDCVRGNRFNFGRRNECKVCTFPDDPR